MLQQGQGHKKVVEHCDIAIVRLIPTNFLNSWECCDMLNKLLHSVVKTFNIMSCPVPVMKEVGCEHQHE